MPHGVHAVQALDIKHPRDQVRDTGRYPPLMWKNKAEWKPSPKPLRHLALEELGVAIQRGTHCSVEDSRAAMQLYLKHREVGPPSCTGRASAEFVTCFAKGLAQTHTPE